MRIANVDGRLCLVVDGGTVDVQAASEGKFDANPERVYDRWDEFAGWAQSARLPAAAELDDLSLLRPPSPAPRQVLAIGLNYIDHATESGFAKPDSHPPVFTKFTSSITSPYTEVRLPEDGHTDWEVELVAIMGRRAFRVDEASAWDYVAGLSVGQDLSERRLQMATEPPQFSLGKSYPGFGPVGPWLVTVDEFDDPDDLVLECSVNGVQMQEGRTRDLIFGVPALVAYLSRVMLLLPGDMLFTGTPAGVGMGRNPQRWLAAGDELVSRIENIGEIRQRFTG
jgi:2-keto-4-pentenoate hydratase/2-oxohepta-3-ene-1,7-dioic acid hydratase in catechol pathway